MQISIAIMAHPKRVGHAETMLSQLEQERADHPESFPWPVDIMVDDAGLGCWGNARRCYEAGLSQVGQATGHVVLQDDIELSPDFLGGVAHLHRMFPHDPQSHFYTLPGVSKAQEAGSHWITSRTYIGAQCHLIPTELIQPFLAYVDMQEGNDAFPATMRRSQDQRLLWFYKEIKQRILCPVPSLVQQHARTMPSVMGNPLRTSAGWRESKWYVGQPGWRSVDWRAGADKPMRV